MERIIRMILPLVMAIATLPVMNAQQRKGNHPSREQFAEVQAKKIAEELKLDDNATKQFVTTYTNCQKEIWASSPRPNRANRDKKESLTDDEALQIIKDRFAQQNKINEIKEKYFTEYSKFLTPRQILKVYNMEKKMMDKMFRQHMDRRSGDKDRKGPNRARGDMRPKAPEAAPATT